MLNQPLRKIRLARGRAKMWLANNELDIKVSIVFLTLILLGFVLGRCSAGDESERVREDARRHIDAVERSRVRRDSVFRTEQRLLREDLERARERVYACERGGAQGDALAQSDAIAAEVHAAGQEALARRRGGRRQPVEGTP